METAVEAAKAAFKTWSKTSILTRQQVMFRYQHIIRSNMVLSFRISFIFYAYNFVTYQKELAKNITEEQGKTTVDAEGDVLRGLRKTCYNPFVFLMI